MRDEDINFPPTIESQTKLSLKEILSGLQENLEKLSQSQTQHSVVIAGHMKLMRALLLLTLNILNREALVKYVENEEESKENAGGGGKKKKGKAAKKEAKKPGENVLDIDGLINVL